MSATGQEVHIFSDTTDMHRREPVSRELSVFFYATLRHLVFWLCFFQIIRAVFLLYHLPLAGQLDAPTIFRLFLYGLYVDTSASCYLIIVPFLCNFVQLFRPSRLLTSAVTAYSLSMAGLVAVICTADLEIYREWGVKLNTPALRYLRYPQEAAASMASSPLFLLGGICLGLMLIGYCGLRMLRRRADVAATNNSPTAVLLKISAFLCLGAVIFIGIRGSFGAAPMNPSFAYFSNHQFANHAALNTPWNLMYDIKHYRRSNRNRITYMPDDEMKTRLARITANGTQNDTEYILKTDRPNIICIILESWTADVIQSLGGVPGLTPNFENLAANGLAFTHIYSSGDRTSYGLPAVLSGFPSTPGSSIMGSPQKMEKLPVLSKELSRAGYRTSFYYGGDNHFDNMRAFFMHAGFEKIIDKSSFSAKDMDSKWGAHDHSLYEKVLEDLHNTRQPFFVSLLTLSSHEPYEVPMKRVIPGADETALFKNAMVYADRSLGDFFRKAATEPWFKNTLFILVADHGHRLPRGRQGHEPEKYHIPLLFYGDVLQNRYKGTKKRGVGSQTDIAATLLRQLNLQHDSYEWSNNLLNRNRNNYAFYNFKDGFGWCTDSQTIGFNNISKKVILNTNPRLPEPETAEALKDSQAYMQYISIKYAGF